MKFTNYSQPTKTKSKGQEGADNTAVGTIIVLLAGIILYSDKIIDYYDIQIAYDFKYYGSLDVFIWTLTGTISPLLLLLGYFLKTEKWAIASPLTAYSVQLVYLMRDEQLIHRDYFWLYTAAFMVFFVGMVYVVRAISEKRKKYVAIIRELFDFIGPETEKRGFIKPEMRKQHSKRRVELVNKAVGNE